MDYLPFVREPIGRFPYLYLATNVPYHYVSIEQVVEDFGEWHLLFCYFLHLTNQFQSAKFVKVDIL